MKKIFVIILIFSIFFSSFIFEAKKSYAVLGVGDVVSDPLDEIENTFGQIGTWLSTGYDAIANSDSILGQAAKYALLVALTITMNEITNSTVSWINNGFDGKPGFVQNPQGLIKKAADQAGGSVLTQLFGNQICEPFKLNIQIPLASTPTFGGEVKCTLSNVVSNINNFYNDFSQGGWIGWIHLTSPQNNAYGAFIMANQEKLNREAKAQNDIFTDINVNKGYYSVAECTGNYDVIDNATGHDLRTESITGKTKESVWSKADRFNIEAEGAVTYILEDPVSCSTKTPADLVSANLNKTIAGGSDLLNQSISNLTSQLGPVGKFMAPYITAILNTLIKKGVQEGLSAAASAFTDSNNAVNTSIPSTAQVDDANLVSQTQSDVAVAETIKKELDPSLKQQEENVRNALVTAIKVGGIAQQNDINILQTEGKMAAVNEALVQGGRTAACVFPTETNRTITTAITSSNATTNSTNLDNKMARNIQTKVTDSKYGTTTTSYLYSALLNVVTATSQNQLTLLTNVGVSSITPVLPPGYQTTIDTQLNSLTAEKTSVDTSLNGIDPAMTALQTFIDTANSFIVIGQANIAARTTISNTDKNNLTATKNSALSSLAPIIAPKTATTFSEYNSKIADLLTSTFDRADQIKSLTGSPSSTDTSTLYGQQNVSSDALTSIRTSYSACAAF